jgi:hypothetical protein
MVAARAPTYYRLLERILDSCELPEDLREVVEINLWRGAPDLRQQPVVRARTRKTAWAHLLDEDL